MNPAIANSPSARLVELHDALQSEIDQLGAWLKEADEYGLPQFGQLGDRVSAIRNVVAEHFQLEDEGGYLAAPLVAAPELADRAAALHAEHSRLLAEFDALAAELRASPCKYDCWSAARHDFGQVLDHLRQHEHRENDLWQEAFEVESGTVD